KFEVEENEVESFIGFQGAGAAVGEFDLISVSPHGLSQNISGLPVGFRQQDMHQSPGSWAPERQ
ncbi:hypothetical protein, partial [Streptomyces sp. DB-54]